MSGPGTADPGVEVFSDRVMNGWISDPASRALATNVQIMDLLAGIYRRRPVPFLTLAFSHGTEQALHRDSFYSQSDPPGLIVTAWVALEDVDLENGPIAYVPGSHRHVARTTSIDTGPDISAEGHFAAVSAELDELQLVAVPAVAKRGDIVLFVGDLIHGGSKRIAPDRTRFSHLTHYTFEGATIWSPRRSGPDERHQRSFVAIR